MSPATDPSPDSPPTLQQRREDVAYTLNHALACTVTDLLSPSIGNATQRYLGRRIEVGCGHDHSAPAAAPSSYRPAQETAQETAPQRPVSSTAPPSAPPAAYTPSGNRGKPAPRRNGMFTRLVDEEAGEAAPAATARMKRVAPGQPPRQTGVFTRLLAEEGAAATGTDGHNTEGTYQRMRPAGTCEHAPGKPHYRYTYTRVETPPSHLAHWWKGEIIGDFGALPVTMATQWLFPGLMRQLREVLEPVMAPFFHAGSRMAARAWAKEHHLYPDAPQAKQEEHQIYEREMSHLPQAVVWTVSASALNIATQRASGNTGPLTHLLAGKLAGSATSAALVVGFRALAPQPAYRWDQFTSEKLFAPITRAVLPARWQDKVTHAPDTDSQITRQ